MSLNAVSENSPSWSDYADRQLLLPIQDAAARIETAMGSLAGGDLLTSPAITMSEVDLESVREECRHASEEELRVTLARLTEAGATATGRVIHEPPVDALAAARRSGIAA